MGEVRKQANRPASSRIKSVPRDTFEQKKDKHKKLQETKRKAEELIAVRNNIRKIKYNSEAQKRKRKERNQFQNGTYQIITKTERLRKWHKKAKKTLMTMSMEDMEKLVSKK